MLCEDWFFPSGRYHVDTLIFVTNIGQGNWDCSKEEDCKTCRLQVPFVVSDQIFSEVTKLLDFLVRM